MRHLLLHLSCLAISHRVLSRYLPNNASSPSRCYFPLLITLCLRRFPPSPIPPPTIPSRHFHRSPLARRFCIYRIFPSLTMFSRSYHRSPVPPPPQHYILLAISSPFLPLRPSWPTKPARSSRRPLHALPGDQHWLPRNRRPPTAAVLHLLLHLSCLAISYDILSRRLPSNASSPP